MPGSLALQASDRITSLKSVLAALLVPESLVGALLTGLLSLIIQAVWYRN